jgi:hypothetical protein
MIPRLLQLIGFWQKGESSGEGMYQDLSSWAKSKDRTWPFAEQKPWDLLPQRPKEEFPEVSLPQHQTAGSFDFTIASRSEAIVTLRMTRV